MEGLSQQIANIQKATAYDIIVAQRNELLEDNKRLQARVEFLENLIKEFTGKMIANLTTPA